MGMMGKSYLAGKLEVALVAAGNGHYSTGAVIGNDVVGNPNGNLFAVDGVDNIAAGEGTMLFAVTLGSLYGAHLGSALDQSHNLGFVFGAAHQVVYQRAFRGKQEEAAPEQGIGARGEYRDGLAVVFALGGDQLEINAFRRLRNDRSSWPAFRLNGIGPTFQLIKIVQQFLGVIGDLVYHWVRSRFSTAP